MAQLQTDALYHSFVSDDPSIHQVQETNSTTTKAMSDNSSAPTPMETAGDSSLDTAKETVSDSNSSSSAAKETTKELVKDKPLFCPYCDTQSKDAQEFQEHVFSDEHIKTAFITNKKMERGKSLVLPKKLENLRAEPEKKKQPLLLHCQTCMISCNGENAWNAHLVGQKHRKVLEKIREERMQTKAQSSAKPLMRPHNLKPYERPGAPMKKAVPLGQQDFQNYKEPLIGLEYVTEIQVMGQNTRYHCELCDCKFDGNLKFPHLVGAKHRFNVLKEKRPDVAVSIRSHDNSKKRSELTVQLRDEAAKLEQEEGRKMVKLRVEKSPFEKVNAAAAGRGKNPFNNPSNRGQFTQNRGQNNFRGQSNPRGQSNLRGQASAMRGLSNRGSLQAGRGSTFAGRGRGRGQRGGYQGGRGGAAGGGGGSWTGSQWSDSSPYGYNDNTAYNFYYSNSSNTSNNQGSMLPKEAFRPMETSQSYQTSGWYSGYSDSYNSTNKNTAFAGNTSTSRQDSQTWGTASQSTPQQSQVKADPNSAVSASHLSKMLDLSKLVSSEDDAAVALQVSNALTQALLTFRMNSLQGDGGDGSQPPPS